MADETLLPPLLASDARARALHGLTDRLDAVDLVPLLVYRIESVPAGALYPLAWQFGVLGLAGWDLADTEAKRRALVLSAIELHRHKGTPWAVRTSLVALGYPDTAVDEAVGIPFAFRVKLGVIADGDTITPERQALLIGTVGVWKNARSVLTDLRFTAPAEADQLPALQEDPMEIIVRTYNRYDGTHRFDGSITYEGTHAETLEAV